MSGAEAEEVIYLKEGRFHAVEALVKQEAHSQVHDRAASSCILDVQRQFEGWAQTLNLNVERSESVSNGSTHQYGYSFGSKSILLHKNMWQIFSLSAVFFFFFKLYSKKEVLVPFPI